MFKIHFFALAMLAPSFLLGCGEENTNTAAPLPSQNALSSESNEDETSTSNDVVDNSLVTPPAQNVKLAQLPAPYNTADYDKGRRQYSTCKSCHNLIEGAGHRVGPNLHGVFDRKIGQAEGFKYSKAIEAADFQWTPERLDQWLANPRKFLPGNRMTFAGISNATQRENLIAYLMVETAK